MLQSPFTAKNLKSDPSKLTLADRVKLFDSLSTSGDPLTSLPPQAHGSAPSSRRGRRKLNTARFQTQPITVDEVEKARRDYAAEALPRPNPTLLRVAPLGEFQSNSKLNIVELFRKCFICFLIIFFAGKGRLKVKCGNIIDSCMLLNVNYSVLISRYYLS